jgi:Phosphotransferase enzyme family
VTYLSPEVVSTIDRWWHLTNPDRSTWIAQAVDGYGYSVASVWRIGSDVHDSSCEQWALKSWGLDASHERRLEKILAFQESLYHRLIRSGQEIVDLNPIPKVIPFNRGAAILCSEGTVWTLTSWCPGQAIRAGTSLTKAFLSHSARLLAKLHDAGQGYELQIGTSASLRKRWECIQTWSNDVLASKVNRWLETTFQRSSSIEREELWKGLIAAFHQAQIGLHTLRRQFAKRLEEEAIRPRACHWIIGDLWRENVLVDPSNPHEVSGLIDFGAARLDWAPLEVVRWFSSILEPSDTRIEELLQLYYQERKRLANNEYDLFSVELTPADFQWFDFLSTTTSLLQWFQWLVEKDFDSEYIIRKVCPRIQELAWRLESLHCSTFPFS